jgi:hypothetical protein
MSPFGEEDKYSYTINPDGLNMPYNVSAGFDIGTVETQRILVVTCHFPWKWKYIHWWHGIDKFVKVIDVNRVEIMPSYDSLWETIKGLFK